MGKKIGLIFGATGQDAAHLSRLLLDKGYSVIGVKRRTSTNNTARIAELLDNPNYLLLDGDVTDPHSTFFIIKRYQPCEIYNTAAQSFVGVSFATPYSTLEVDTIGVLNILEAIKNYSPHSRFLQCSTSEMFGDSFSTDSDGHKYQDEQTSFTPNSPYAIAKLAAHNFVDLYRRSYGLHASCSITFNHEGEYRGEEFVTRKITQYVARLYAHRNICANTVCFEPLKLGNVFSYRDWHWAGDAVRGMWLMLQQRTPDDYVLSSDETHSIKEFTKLAFEEIGVESWEGYVQTDKSLLRPMEVPYLCGRSTKARNVLGWEPQITFRELISRMVLNDIDIERRNYNGNAQFSRVAQ